MIETIFPVQMFHAKMPMSDEESSSLNATCQAIFRNHTAMKGISFQEAGDDGVHIPVFTDDNIKAYKEIRKLHDYFAKSFHQLAQEYDNRITFEEVLECMEETTGRLPFMRKGDYKGLHCHSGASLVAVFYLDDVDNDKDGGKLILHDPAFNQIIRTKPKRKMEMDTEKHCIIIVPAHVWHEVTPYNGDEDRLAVVMNISFPYK